VENPSCYGFLRKVIYLNGVIFHIELLVYRRATLKIHGIYDPLGLQS
jgi:hypothetical protein